MIITRPPRAPSPLPRKPRVLPVFLYPIDPGVHGSAAGVFFNGELNRIMYPIKDWTLQIYPGAEFTTPPGEIVLEMPVADKDPRKTKDLIDLHGAGMWLAATVQAASGFRCSLIKKPARSIKGQRGWKGTIEKPVHHSRVLRTLNAAELAVVLRIKPDVHAHVEAACHRLAIEGKVSRYSDPIHNVLDMVALGLNHLGRLV